MTTVEFITALFCQVDDQMPSLPKHPHASLWPSEVVTLGLPPCSPNCAGCPSPNTSLQGQPPPSGGLRWLRKAAAAGALAGCWEAPAGRRPGARRCRAHAALRRQRQGQAALLQGGGAAAAGQPGRRRAAGGLALRAVLRFRVPPWPQPQRA